MIPCNWSNERTSRNREIPDDLLFVDERVECLSFQELSRASSDFDFSVFYTNFSVYNDDLGNSVTFHAFEDVEIASVVMSFCRNCSRCFVIPDNEITVSADSDWTFLWIKVEYFRSICSETIIFEILVSLLNFKRFYDVTATNRCGSMIPAWTPFSQTTLIRSSTPLTPFGIFEKSFKPNSFCSLLNVQLSDPVVWRSSLKWVGS